jgi:hypothetical protein
VIEAPLLEEEIRRRARENVTQIQKMLVRALEMMA